MSKLDDMTETMLHDRFDGYGFDLVSRSEVGVVNEYPLRGVDMEVDYRQPGFQFRRLDSGLYTLAWPSFVENIEVRNSGWTARDGDAFVLVVDVLFRKVKKDLPGPKSSPSPKTSKNKDPHFVVSHYNVRSAFVEVYNSRRRPPLPTSQSEKSGSDRLVQTLAFVGADGEITSNPNFPHLGNLFISRPEIGVPVGLTSFTF